MNVIELKPPYLIFLGDVTEMVYAKTGAGLVQWRPELCAGQLRLIDEAIDLGLPPMTVAQAQRQGVRSLVLGTASVGGGIASSWEDTLLEAAEAGLDIVAGLHVPLMSNARLAAAAHHSGARLIDVRLPPSFLPVGTGKKRSGMRVLTVGTDCAVGKKYTALALERDMHSCGMSATFRASGQTGIMIAGQGIPIDAVVADFISGAAELLSPDNDSDHWDVIEGQGSLTHPGFAAVTTGLLLGSQPDAFIVCHEAGRSRISGWTDYALPSIVEIIERTIAVGSITNPDVFCAGISVNTSGLKPEERRGYLDALEQELGLPCVDPIVNGTTAIISRLQGLEKGVRPSSLGAAQCR